MRRPIALFFVLILFNLANQVQAQRVYSGFDRNDYPGDQVISKLRKSFDYSSFWLNSPPGRDFNSWAGKRSVLKKLGFGFLVLFNGRLSNELTGKDADAIGRSEGKLAVALARHEGFPKDVLIFLDQEQGGRLLPDQTAYIFGWADAVREDGARAGIYCSGLEVFDGNKSINTASQIQSLEVERLNSPHRDMNKRSKARLALWVANDQCPPSPGCSPSALLPSEGARVPYPSAIVTWQYAQSPRRSQFSINCPKNHSPDGNCYAPGLAPTPQTFIDLDVSRSPNPSERR